MSVPPPANVHYHENRIAQLVALKDGWHEPGSRAMTAKATELVRRLWDIHGTGGALFPMPEGGYLIEWEDGLEVEIKADGTIRRGDDEDDNDGREKPPAVTPGGGSL